MRALLEHVRTVAMRNGLLDGDEVRQVRVMERIEAPDLGEYVDVILWPGLPKGPRLVYNDLTGAVDLIPESREA